MLLKLESERKIHGVKIGRLSSSISHLFFASDILFFCRANLEDIKELKECPTQYYKCTGQKFNFNKSRCFFFKNTQAKTKTCIKKIIEMSELPTEMKYLGNPLFRSRNHSKAYEELKSKIEARLQGWKSYLLSQTSKYILIKSVVSSTPF